MEQMRLQKYMAEAGIASRRKCEELISGGHVAVNGEKVTHMGVKVSDRDVLEVNGERIYIEKNKVYIMLNKPAGYITTVKDQFSRPSVIDLVSGIKQRIYPVGRLDYDTSGLLILTNDGQLAYRLTHPRHEIEKKYIAEVKGVPGRLEVDLFKRGMNIDDYTASPAGLKILREKGHDREGCNSVNAIVEIIIHEGKNRQVRKMCEAIGHPIISLKRAAVGKLKLEDLPEGKWRHLTSEEVKDLSC